MSTAEKRIADLRERASRLPLCPGVYLMRDKAGRVIYVGKSRKLRNRVLSYFTGTHTSKKTARMVSLVHDFDFIVCDTEMEALTLENVQIKQYSPRYNIRLKDDKSYPYIKITAEAYPRVVVTRARPADGGRYFGPYRGMSDAYGAADAVNRIFRLPTCRRVFPRDIGKERPCLYRQMGRCVAPCTGEVPQDAYNALVKSARFVLEGNTSATVSSLEEEMRAAAMAERFEEAAALRDSVQALRRLSEKQKVVGDETVEQDVFACLCDDLCSVIAVLCIRQGKLVSKNELLLPVEARTDGEALSAFLCDWYGDRPVPREVLLDFSLEEEDTSLLCDYLSERAGRRVSVRQPMRGALRQLCDMALANARERAALYRTENDREDRALSRLSLLLSLEALPARVEAYDISNIGREHITASMVVYAEGKLKKSDYRSFIIRETDGVDDYGSMREALTRRLSHIGDGSPSLGERPDLILLDGGAGHVRVGKEVLAACGYGDIPLFGMVKDDFHKTRALTDGDRDIGIATEQAVFVWVYKLQEEAHRFAVSRSGGAKRKTLRHSSLEKIPGIGPKKAAILLTCFGNLRRIAAADYENLTSVPGISQRDASHILRYFSQKEAEKKNKAPVAGDTDIKE